MSKEVWVVSNNEEDFSSDEYSSREDAIKNGAEELDKESGDTFYIGKKKDYVLPTPSAEDYFSDLLEKDIDHLGDWSEFWERGWSKHSDISELVNEKLSEITDIIMTGHKPNFYNVVDVEHVEAP